LIVNKAGTYFNNQDIIVDYNSGIPREEMIMEIYQGLSAEKKWISSRYLYDDEGARLFNDITGLPEYYLTRIEKGLLAQFASQIIDPEVYTEIIDLGSGDCSKISLLISGIPEAKYRNIKYIPVDVNESSVVNSVEAIKSRFPGIGAEGISTDFLKHNFLLKSTFRRLFCFFGSTIGNFDHPDAVAFLKRLNRYMNSGDILLVGFDMVKDVRIIENAYNDTRGITALFNRNILNVVNTIAGTEFNPELFSHIAFFNHKYSRIEMHLRATENVCTVIPSLSKKIIVEKGDTLHTENSYKYTSDRIENYAKATGLRIHKVFNDPQKWFSLVYFVKH